MKRGKYNRVKRNMQRLADEVGVKYHAIHWLYRDGQIQPYDGKKQWTLATYNHLMKQLKREMK